jgi:hypothetical protein
MGSRTIKEIMSSPEFNRQFKEAGIRGKQRLKELPKASSARYDAKSHRLVLEMQNGVTLLVPVNLIQGLQTDDVRALSDFELVSKGTQIHWNTLDVQFYVESLLHGVFGTAKWMSELKRHLSEIGRKGGSSKSAAKRVASAENGKKGGRPRTRRTA